eukprot:FR739802.1.p1 GENE.FR739802.1~~FR739802.1.p1  ORF type:complete len:133 (+),score=19.24 FR739802.1:49-399(+)
MLLDQFNDYDNAFTGVSYRGGLESFLAERLPVIIAGVSEALGEKLYLVGDSGPTVVDFKAFELLLKFAVAYGDDALGSGNVAQYVARMKALPTLAHYFASDRYISHPINNHHAQFK